MVLSKETLIFPGNINHTNMIPEIDFRLMLDPRIDVLCESGAGGRSGSGRSSSTSPGPSSGRTALWTTRSRRSARPRPAWTSVTCEWRHCMLSTISLLLAHAVSSSCCFAFAAAAVRYSNSYATCYMVLELARPSATQACMQCIILS